MKAILLSIKPEWAEKILNGEKTIEARKQFPKDFRGWVYLYITKGKPYLHRWCRTNGDKGYMLTDEKEYSLNGKVVARFYVDNVEEFDFIEENKYKDNIDKYNEIIRKLNDICKKSCLSASEMISYLDRKCLGTNQDKMLGYAIHISQLQIFDKPKEISDYGIKKAPQSWQYIEVEE